MIICFQNLIIYIGKLDMLVRNQLNANIIDMLPRKKKRLIESGVDAEELRLYCRHLSNLRNERAENRLQAYSKTLNTYRSSGVI